VKEEKVALLIVGGMIFIIALWLAIEAVIRLVQYGRGRIADVSFGGRDGG
jgi:hypothetical protein